MEFIKKIIRKINFWRYERFLTNVEKPLPEIRSDFEKYHQQLWADGYYSQEGQDKWVFERLLPGKKAGFFVDIGAHDGVSFSNTLFLEKQGWNGVCVEPNPQVFEKLQKNRNCITVQGCIANRMGHQKFRVISGRSEMLSGLVNEYDPRHLDRITKEIRQHGGGYQDIDVQCFTLVGLLKELGISQVDYLNLDVEGAEYKILQGINFDHLLISIIGVENNYLNWKIPKLMISQGYFLHSIVGDEFYLRANK